MSEATPDDVDLGIIVDPELVAIVTGLQAYNGDAGDMLDEATIGASYSRLPRSDMATSQILFSNTQRHRVTAAGGDDRWFGINGTMHPRRCTAENFDDGDNSLGKIVSSPSVQGRI
jgi:hypothetical protein